MSICWIDAIDEIDGLTWLRSPYSQDNQYYRVINLDYDLFGQKIIVDKDQLDIRYFFHWYNLPERFFGLSMPIKQLSQQVLGLIYRMHEGMLATLSIMIQRPLKHIMVALLSFIILPILALYQLVYCQIYLVLVHSPDIGPSFWWSGLTHLAGYMVSTTVILLIECLRSVIALLLNTLLLLISIPLFCLKLGLSQLFNYSFPGHTLAIKTQANKFMQAENKKMEGMVEKLMNKKQNKSENIETILIALVNQYLKESHPDQNLTEEIIQPKMPPMIAHKDGVYTVLKSEDDTYDQVSETSQLAEKVVKQLNDNKTCLSDINGFFKNENLQDLSSRLMGSDWVKCYNRLQLLPNMHG